MRWMNGDVSRLSDCDDVEACRAVTASSQTDLMTCSDISYVRRPTLSCSRLSDDDDDGYDVIVDDSDDDDNDVIDDSFARREVRDVEKSQPCR